MCAIELRNTKKKDNPLKVEDSIGQGELPKSGLNIWNESQFVVVFFFVTSSVKSIKFQGRSDLCCKRNLLSHVIRFGKTRY